MESEEIAKLIAGFNVAAVAAMSVFAVCGIIAALGRMRGWGILSKRVFLWAFCVAALAAFVLEVTVFNFPHYLKYFADSELATSELVPEDPARVMTTKVGYAAEIVEQTEDAAKVSAGILFRNLDMRVTSIFVELDWVRGDVANIQVEWTDEESTRGFAKIIRRHVPYDRYLVIQPSGTVSELRVMFSDINVGTNINIVSVSLNKQIPYYFSGLRLFAVSLLIFAAILLICRGLRAKTAYYLFEYRFNPASRKQNLVYALLVVLLIGFSWTSVYTSRYNMSTEETPWGMQYNKYLVDAIIEGRVWLDVVGDAAPEKLLGAERPYDPAWRKANGFVGGNYMVDGNYMYDWTWHNGKYYCYMGPVPALVLFVPYKLITGNYLGNHAGIFIFAAVSVILLAWLWRYCVRRWMPGARAFFFMLGFLTLYFVAGYYSVLTFVRFYSIPQIGAFTFALAGTLLLLKSIEGEKTNRLKLFFACLCLALVVGCRPNMIFVSLLVPALLWKRRSWGLLVLVLIPYLLVAIPMMIYNYARYDSVFSFYGGGALTDVDLPALALINPIGAVLRTFSFAISCLFSPLIYSLEFPWLTSYQWHMGARYTYGFMSTDMGMPGMINFPVIFCLFWLLKKDGRQYMPAPAGGVVRAFLIAGVFLICGIIWFGIISARYMLDVATFVVIPSLFCAYFWSECPKSEMSGRLRLKVIYALLAVSTLVGMLLFVTGAMNGIRNMTMFRYLEYSFGFIGK